LQRLRVFDTERHGRHDNMEIEKRKRKRKPKISEAVRTINQLLPSIINIGIATAFMQEMNNIFNEPTDRNIARYGRLKDRSGQ